MTYNELCEAILTAQEELLKYKVEANSVSLNGRRYGKLIENCPPNMKPTIFGMAVKFDYALPDDYDFLVQYEPPQPQTNADRIRAMTDEELAEFLNHVNTAYCSFVMGKSPCKFESTECPCWLSWLKAPVEEVDNGT